MAEGTRQYAPIAQYKSVEALRARLRELSIELPLDQLL